MPDSTGTVTVVQWADGEGAKPPHDLHDHDVEEFVLRPAVPSGRSRRSSTLLAAVVLGRLDSQPDRVTA
jgi:hypothetical protein